MKFYKAFIGVLFLLVLTSCGSDEAEITSINASFTTEQSEYFVAVPIRFTK